MPRQTAGAITGLETLEGVFDWVLRLSALALIGITGYYIYGTMAAGDSLFRGMGAGGQAMSAADFQRHVGNMELLTKFLVAASIGGAVGALGRYYKYPETGAALLLLGAALFFGMPLLIQSFGGQGGVAAPALKRLNLIDPQTYLIGRFNLSGLVLLGSGVAHLLFHGVILVAGMGRRRPKPNEEAARTAASVRKPNDRFLGKCWDLPFCRDTDKKLCPIRQTNKPCWRTGRGCYCDQNVILTLSGGNQYQASRGAAGYLSRSATTISRPKSLREKRDQCLQCPVYLHHQGQKYRLMAPVSLVAAVGLLAYYSATILGSYKTAMLSLGSKLSGFSFGATQGGVPAWANDLASNQGIMWMLIVVGGMLVVAYLLHGVEWMLYRLGI